MAIGPQIVPVIPATSQSALNITSATVIKASRGVVGAVSVVVAGSGAGSINDCKTTGAAAAANKIATIPDTAAVVLTLNFPARVGICVTPGTGHK